MPKFVSGFVRKCMVVFQKDEPPKATASNNKNKEEEKRKNARLKKFSLAFYFCTVSTLDGTKALITVIIHVELYLI